MHYNFFEMDLLKIPWVAFSENLNYNLEACILIYSEEKIRCFDLNPDGSFSAVYVEFFQEMNEPCWYE